MLQTSRSQAQPQAQVRQHGAHHSCLLWLWQLIRRARAVPGHQLLAQLAAAASSLRWGTIGRSTSQSCHDLPALQVARRTAVPPLTC